MNDTVSDEICRSGLADFLFSWRDRTVLLVNSFELLVINDVKSHDMECNRGVPY